ncbi:hypothetical protein EV126DRAFT_428529 [Verticillium dahliae]|nr:hypothetical protein EV126DRAFT_428529 [Verticillium dahliae]
MRRTVHFPFFFSPSLAVFGLFACQATSQRAIRWGSWSSWASKAPGFETRGCERGVWSTVPWLTLGSGGFGGYLPRYLRYLGTCSLAREVNECTHVKPPT